MCSQVHLRIHCSSIAKTLLLTSVIDEACYENAKEKSQFILFIPLFIALFFQMLCNRREAAPMLYLRIFYLILQTKSVLKEPGDLFFVRRLHVGLRSSPSPLWAAENTVALTISFLVSKLQCYLYRN